MKIRKGWYVLFVAPLMIMFTIVQLVPFITGIGYSFVSWNGLPKSPKVGVGFANYIRIFSDKQFLASIFRTTGFTLITVVIVNVLALAFAVFVTGKLRTRNIARTMLFMPYMIGGLILGYIWNYVLGEGMTALGEVTDMKNVFFNWLVNKQFAFYAMIVVATWQMAGYMMIIYIAGFQSIPEDIIEAARVDGANGLQALFFIKLPLTLSSITICLFMTTSNCFKIYDVNVSLTDGGPNNATQMVSMNIFDEIFTKSNFGYGQAKAILFFIVIALITLFQMRLTREKEEEV